MKNFITIILILNLSILSFSQDLLYQFKDVFNNNLYEWRLVNTPDWKADIANGYLSIENTTSNQYSYFRPSKNVIPKSAIYKITAKMIFKFGKIGENYLSGGFNFIRNENISEDGTYSSINDDFKIGFNKFRNKSYVRFQGFNGAIFAWKPIDMDLLDNMEYKIEILIDNTTNSDPIKIKINDKLVCSYNANIFNFTNIGIFNYPNGGLKVNSLEIYSYGGKLNFIDDLFCNEYKINNNGQIIGQRFKSISDYEDVLLNFIPKELINFHRTPFDKRDVQKLLEKLALNPEINNYNIYPEKRNENNIVEQHCFYYKNDENAICLPISIGKDNIKIITASQFISSNKRKLVSYSNILGTIFDLPNIKSIGNDIIMERTATSMERLFIDENRVVFWF